MRAARLFLVGFAIATVACASCSADNLDRVPNGTWGGQHMGMVVSDSGATIEYDCASGKITQPLRLDAAGRFDWRGVHYFGHGGPIYQGETTTAHPARFAGRATRDQMSITVTLVDTTTFTPQTYSLVRGANPNVFKCL